MMQRVMVYDNEDRFLFELSPKEVLHLTLDETINGEHSLTIDTTHVLGSGNRILTKDNRGIWREHVVYGTDQTHKSGVTINGIYHCVWSLQHDLMGTTVSKMPGVQTPVTAESALEDALSGTSRWVTGTVTRTSSGGASMYDCSGWEALSTLVDVWGGEVGTTIEVSNSGIVSRKVDLYEHQGETEPLRRFDFGADVESIRRKVDDGPVYCRISPRGKGEAKDSGGYGRKITIKPVNGQIDWLQNDAMVPYARVKTATGYEYPTLIVENSDCETPQQLKQWGLSVLEEYTTPKVVYEADVVQAASEGVDLKGISLGDEVHIVDKNFGGDGLRLSARVMSVETDMLEDKKIKLVIGNAKEGIADIFEEIRNNFSRASARISEALAEQEYMATSQYLSELLDRLNAEINADGGYTYITQGQGIRTYDQEVSDPLIGAEATKVVEIKGGSIRIANTKTAQGEWDWKTVFTSGHIAAYMVTAANITAGYIGSADSGNYWDLDTGEFRMAATANIGDRTVQQMLADVDATITDVDIEYASGTSSTTAPTSGWSTTAPTWQSGRYIWQRTATTTAQGTTYSQPTCISGRDGVDGSSVSILGSYNTYAELIAAHPTGNIGDGYIVAGDLYVWDGSQWDDVGQIQGPQGPAGQDGASVTVSSITYGVSDSASAQPSSWSANPPTSIAKGKWLWVKTNYSDGSNSITKSYVGTDGDDGTSIYITSSTKVDGVTTVRLSDGTTLTINDGEDGATGQQGPAGANGESNYIHTAWANSADGTTDFSTTVSANKSYLGVCTDQNTADPTTPSSYSWSKIEGDAGADGTGVSGIVEQYYLSTSSTTQMGGFWSTSQPAWQSEKYIWTRSKITWTDGDITYTSPVLAQAINGANQSAKDAAKDAIDAIDDMELGSTNLVRNGDFFSGTDLWSSSSGTTITAQEVPTFGHCLKAEQGYEGGYWNQYVRANSANFQTEANVTYSISFWAKSDSANTIYAAVGNGAELVSGEEVSTTWKRFTGTGSYRYQGRLSFWLGSAGTLYIANVMLVESDKPMVTWGPDPRDALVKVDSYLTQQEVFNRLTNNGALQGLYMSNGKLYINATYVNTGYLGNANGNYWNLDSGYLTITNGDVNGTLAVKNTSGNVVLKINGWGLSGGDNYYATHCLQASDSEMAIYGKSRKRFRIAATSDSLYNANMDVFGSARIYNDVKIGNWERGASYYSLITTSTSKIIGNLNVGDDFSVGGRKSRRVDTDNYDVRLLYSYETTSPLFGDVGSGIIGEDGTCVVMVDDIFSETARTDLAYQIFLQKCGQGDLWVSDKSMTHFTVEGTPGLTFDWELKCHQTGYEHTRIEQHGMDLDGPEDTEDIESMYGNYVEDIELALIN